MHLTNLCWGDYFALEIDYLVVLNPLITQLLPTTRAGTIVTAFPLIQQSYWSVQFYQV